MTTLSNSHACPATLPTSSTPKPPTQGRQVDGTRRGRMLQGWGWVGNIDSMSTVLGEGKREGGQRHFSYKANSRPISSHLSKDVGSFFFLFSSPTLCITFSLSLFIFAMLKKKKQGRQRLSSQQSTERGGGTDSSPKDRPESRDIPQCS